MELSRDPEVIFRKDLQHILGQLLVMVTGIGAEVVKKVPGHFQDGHIRHRHRIIPVLLPVSKKKDLPEHVPGLHQIHDVPLSGCKVFADLHLSGKEEKKPGGLAALLKNVSACRILFHS